ncbi:hypothetical protein BSKO_12162 [Bryopsis sp. KO-2023]|nr:hypothetical protein BSKO_12162 [Bryopsis sp. KO-2023]
MKPLTPFKFYGEDAPRKISKDPKQVIEPLMEWAEKAHWKQGGLAGHRGKGPQKEPLPKPSKTAKDFCFEERIKDLAMEPTREEFLAMKPDLMEYWEGISLEEKTKFEALHKDDVERFDREMEEYKTRHPEYETQLRRKNLERKKAVSRKRTTPLRAKRKGAKKARKDVKVEYSESDETSGSELGEGNDQNENQNMEEKTPVRNSYQGAYEFPLSPRSVRRQRREDRKSR